MKTSTVFRLSILSALLGTLAACGGGGGSSSSSSTPVGPSTLSGKVIDGYIRGALVCLDVNSNNKCDPDEPSAISGAGGAYTLPSYPGSITGLRVIAEVGATAVDEDTGPIGVGNTYSMLAPAAASSTVTPLSTLVSATIAAGGGEAQVSIGEAITSVATKTGISVEKLLAVDYKQNGDTATANVAQATANAIAQVTNTLRNNADIKTAQITDGQIIQQAVLKVKEQVLPQLVAEGKMTDAASTSSATITAAVVKAVEATNLSGQVQNIVAATKSGEGSVISMVDVFKAGFMTAEDQSTRYINSAGDRYEGNSSGPRFNMLASYIQFDANEKAVNEKRFVLGGNNKWFDEYEGGVSWTFDGSDWVISADTPNSNMALPTFDQNCVVFPHNAKGTVSQRYCAVEKKLDGKLMKDFIPSLCEGGFANSNAACATATFPSGSSAYDLTMTTSSTLPGKYNGIFELWVSKEDIEWGGYCTASYSGNYDCVKPNATIFDFISRTQEQVQFTGYSCNTPFRIQSYDAAAKKGRIQWGSQLKGCQTPDPFSVLETTDFEVIRAGNKDIFIVPTPVTYRANNPNNDNPFMIFAALPGSNGSIGIWNGSYYPVGFKTSIPFTGDPATNTQILSPTMFDAILKIQGITPFPYKGSSSSGKYTGNPSNDPN
jgi:hypothetical protein